MRNSIINKIGISLYMVIAFSACSSELEEGVKFSSELFKVNESSIELSKEATTRIVSIETDCDWNVSASSSNWSDLVVQKASDNSIRIETQENPLRTDRTATITFTTKGGLTKSLSVRQAQGDAYVRTNVESSLSFDETEGTRSFQIQSNTSWMISISYTEGDIDWLELNSSEGSENQSITVSSKKAVSDQERKATITITSTEEGVSASASVSVVQSALSFIQLDVTPEQLTFGSIAGGSQKIKISSNAQWWVWLLDIEPENDLSWITFDKEGGLLNDEIEVSCTDNDTPIRRRAVAIIMSGNKNGGEKRRVNIVQEAGKLPEIKNFTLSTTGYIIDSATFGFDYQSDFTVTEYGLCYSTENRVPTTEDGIVKQEGNKKSESGLSLTIKDLEPRKTFFVRAYAKSNVGTAYSDNVIEISTLGNAPNPDDNPRPF